MRRAGVSIALASLLALAGPGHADDEPAPIAATLDGSAGRVLAAFDVTSTFHEAFRRRIASGIRSVVVIEATLVDADGAPIAKALRQCKMRYEVWDEFLAVELREPNRRAVETLPVIDRGLEACGVVTGLELVELARVDRGARYRLEVTVLLNPVDQETLDNVRDFLANPQGNREAKAQTFFGTLARLFSTRPELGGERFGFRSALSPVRTIPTARPTPPAPSAKPGSAAPVNPPAPNPSPAATPSGPSPVEAAAPRGAP
jgi:hypothetical protein